jgi:6-phosphofructokinase
MQETLAILVGGGPAPGINGVVAAATIEALTKGLRVIGLYDGYRNIAKGDASQIVELTLDDAARMRSLGGSYLRTSRTNPGKDQETLERSVRTLETLAVRYLVAIGGDDTTYGASRIAALTQGRIGVVTIPKTIDNDLPLPEGAPTFGFETARALGTTLVENLMEDARTSPRWYLAVTMGRASGSLALGICKAAGATLALIPEEFPGAPVALDVVVDTLAGAIVKRQVRGEPYGVAVIAEGVADRIVPEHLASQDAAGRDVYGNLLLADVPLGKLLRDALRKRLAELGLTTAILTQDIGYELRCAKPIAFDADYTQTLGYGAVRYLLGGGSGALIAAFGGRIVPLDLHDLLDPTTGRIRLRLVDMAGETYEAARSSMVRLERDDLVEPNLSRLSRETGLSPGDFAARFAASVHGSMQPAGA